jgi:hypothetical protein
MPAPEKPEQQNRYAARKGELDQCRLRAHGSRLTAHGSRPTAHGSGLLWPPAAP